MGRPLAALLLLLVIALGVLATLQYRWIDRVSEAERQQTRANLDFAARRFTDDLRVELGALFDAFGQPDRGELEERYEQWARAAAPRPAPGGLRNPGVFLSSAPALRTPRALRRARFSRRSSSQRTASGTRDDRRAQSRAARENHPPFARRPLFLDGKERRIRSGADERHRDDLSLVTFVARRKNIRRPRSRPP